METVPDLGRKYLDGNGAHAVYFNGEDCMHYLKTIKGFVQDLKNMAAKNCAKTDEWYMPDTIHGQVWCYLEESNHVLLILETPMKCQLEHTMDKIL